MGPELRPRICRMREGLAQPDIARETRPDGSFVLRSRTPLGPFRRSVIDWLVHWATLTPDVPFLAERIRRQGESASWRVVTYADALRQTRSIGQALLDLAAAPERPVTVLSDNSINHALFALGAIWAGDEIRAAAPNHPLVRHGGESALGFVVFAGTVAPALNALPALLAVVVGEIFRIRSWP